MSANTFDHYSACGLEKQKNTHQRYGSDLSEEDAPGETLYCSGRDDGVKLTITERGHSHTHPHRARLQSSRADTMSDMSDDHAMTMTTTTRSTSDGQPDVRAASLYSSRDTALSYIDIREKLQDKYHFKRILRNRSYASHYDFFDTYYSVAEVMCIAKFYGIAQSSMILDEIVRYELDFSNYERVWERYKVWENLAVVRKHRDILRPLMA